MLLEPGLKSFPAYTDWGIDADKDEEGPAEQFVEYGLSVNVCGDPSFAPSLCDKVEKVFGAGEGVLLVCDCTIAIGYYTRRFWCFFRVFLCGTIQGLNWISFRRILLEVEVGETVVFREVVRDSSLSSAYSCDFQRKIQSNVGRDLAHLHTIR